MTGHMQDRDDEPETDDQIGHALSALASGYPEFRFWRAPLGWHSGQRWVCERVNGLSPGLYTVITAHLSELQTALTQDRARQG